MDLSELVIEAVKRDEESEFLVLMRDHHYLGVSYKIGVHFMLQFCKADGLR